MTPLNPVKIGSRFGLGLRPAFYKDACQGSINVDWFEIISENFMVDGGNALSVLNAVGEHYPIALHGVSLNLGGTDPMDQQYLKGLKKLITRAKPIRVSDHLCWTKHGSHHLHDLLPLPYTKEAINHIVPRIKQVQDTLNRQILIENVSSYAEFTQSEMTEWEFLSVIAEQADCLLLLDINNIIVSAHNHGFDPNEYIRNIPMQRVKQIHLAGHSISGPILVDTHDHEITSSVWDLYTKAVNLNSSADVMIERDDNIPPLEDLVCELEYARKIHKKVMAV